MDVKNSIKGMLHASIAVALINCNTHAAPLTTGPVLGPESERLTQDQIISLPLRKVRQAGAVIYSIPFNHADGFGDGPGVNRDNPSSPNSGNTGRPTLQGNGTFLRINGMDTQTCMECHGVVDSSVVPAVLGIPGHGGIAASAMFQPTEIDVDDDRGMSTDDLGVAFYDGRLINPPANFGMGGPQLVGKEMTEELQGLKAECLRNPGTIISLDTKGVNYGTISCDLNGNIDTRNVEGIDHDLIVRPFGRKGEFTSIGAFDEGAMMFHMGIQPIDVVGRDIDADGDGVSNELLTGELSALEIFLASTAPPKESPDRRGERGFKLFKDTGCADCHVPTTETKTRILKFAQPEDPLDMNANVFYQIDLSKQPTHFPKNDQGGVSVNMFSDLKRHDMGPRLAETFSGGGDAKKARELGVFDEESLASKNRQFITTKLWGVASSAPYMHDGRALTLFEAIEMHGGEGQASRDLFMSLKEDDQNKILRFLTSLRNPRNSVEDIKEVKLKN